MSRRRKRARRSAPPRPTLEVDVASDDGSTLHHDLYGEEAEAMALVARAMAAMPDLSIGQVLLVVGAEWAIEREGATGPQLMQAFLGLVDGAEERSANPRLN